MITLIHSFYNLWIYRKHNAGDGWLTENSYMIAGYSLDQARLFLTQCYSPALLKIWHDEGGQKLTYELI